VGEGRRGARKCLEEGKNYTVAVAIPPGCLFKEGWTRLDNLTAFMSRLERGRGNREGIG